MAYDNNYKEVNNMPRRDGTGPMGLGAMSGRGFGPCNTTNVGGYLNGFGRGNGRGFGRGSGFGFGRGFGGVFSNENSAVSNKELLNDQKEYLQQRLEQIKKQLENLS